MKQTAKIKKLQEELARVSSLMLEIHQSYCHMAEFNERLRKQISRDLYFDPPPGIVYGQQTRDASTQTSFVPPKENERADREVEALLERDGC